MRSGIAPFLFFDCAVGSSGLFLARYGNPLVWGGTCSCQGHENEVLFCVWVFGVDCCRILGCECGLTAKNGLWNVAV